MSQSGVCFIGGARYSSPLDATSEKKLRLLKALGELFVIGFSKNLRPRQCNEHAHFYLMPNLPIPLLRYVEVFVLGPLIIFWVIVRHGVQVLVNKAPTKVWLVSWPRRSPPARSRVKKFMACGIPVVSRDLDESFILSEARCGIVCKTQRDFTQALVELTRNREKRASLGKAGRSYAETNLDWSVLVPIYKKVLMS
jgi:glycosyltransferase involved in cell wall biosynthesis